MLSAEVLFPAASNWYLAHGVDASSSGVIAVATNTSVTVLDAGARQVTAVCPLPGRVTGVGLGSGHLCACTADRGVHCFSLSTFAAAGGHKDHSAEPTALVIAGDTTCITGDKRGTIFFWPLPSTSGPTSRLERMASIQENILCMAISNGETGRLAVCYGSGTIAVIDLENLATRATFAHTAAVKSAAWLPDTSTLLVAGQDQSVALWSLGRSAAEDSTCTDTICEAAGRSDFAEGKVWLSVHAISANAIVYSGTRGEIYRWDAAKRRSQRGPNIHNRPIFSIKPVGCEHLVTASMDRLVVLWGHEKNGLQMKWRLSGLGGHALAVRTDGGSFGMISAGDNNLRIMDLMHREHRQHCWVAWKGLATTPTSSAAAPVAAGLWAVGLQDGSIGALKLDTSEGPGVVEILANKSHPGSVSSLCWLVASEAGLVEETAKSETKESQETSGEKLSELPEAKTQDNSAPENATAEQLEQPKKDPEDTSSARPEQPKKGGKAQGKGKDKGKKDSAPRLKVPAGLLLVSLSSKQKLAVTRFQVAASKQLSGAATEPLVLQPLAAGASLVPLAMAAGRHAGSQASVLIVITANKASSDALEVAALHALVPEATSEAAAGLRSYLAAKSLEGVDATVAVMDVQAVVAGDAVGCWRVAAATAKGHLTVFRVPLDGAGASPHPSPIQTVHVRQAHKKPVTDLQWQRAACEQGPVGSSLLLSSSMDGCLKVWSVKEVTSSNGIDIECLHSFAGLVRGHPGTPLLSACWDLSTGKDSMSILAGGRDQLVFRWTANEHLAACSETAEVDVVDTRAGEVTASEQPLAPNLQEEAAKVKAKPLVPAVTSQSRASKAKNKQSSSLLTLTTAAVHQQPLRVKAYDLARLFGASLLQLWPGEASITHQDSGSPNSLLVAAFTNKQAFADWLVDTEIASKMRVVNEERPPDVHKARLLKLWATDVAEVLSSPHVSEISEGVAVSASGAWIWAALAASAGGGAWQAALATLVSDTQRGTAQADSVHHAAAAALALDEVDTAVNLYIQSDLLLDAIMIARLRYPAQHPTVRRLYQRWADDLRRRCLFDLSASCLLAVGQYAAAFADLQEWLPSTVPPQGGCDALSLTGCFTLASLAVLMATSHLEQVLKCTVDDLSAALAYDHRLWWNSAELRKAVESWKNLLLHTLRLGRQHAALALARFHVLGRSLTVGENFLQFVFAGYASALAWWCCLLYENGQTPHADDDEEEDVEGTTPLHSYVRAYKDKVIAHGDWDFEWRALTWLPLFNNEEDKLLTAIVELGRGCASLASGATRFDSGRDAPWDHLTKSLDALALFGETADFSVEAELARIADLTEREVASEPSMISSSDSFVQTSDSANVD